MQRYQEIAVEDESLGFQAYLVIQSSDKRVSFGGTRVDVSVTRELVLDLADNMSLKLAGHGSPVGSAKAGLRASPDDPRLSQFLKQFAEACRWPLLNTTILGKDMGAKQWMLDEIYASLKIPQLGVAQRRGRTEKCPDRLRDLNGYIENMTGKGVFWAIEQALGSDISGARILIQGFGVVGAGVAFHLAGAGAKILGVSDARGAIFDADGLDYEQLFAAKDDHGLLNPGRFPQALNLADRDALLTQSAESLILAAGSYLVDSELAERIQAPLVVEAANLALTPAARNVLHAKGVRVIPDVVANSASAAMVGHQIAAYNTLSPEKLWTDIEANIKRNTKAVDRVSKQLNLNSKAAFRHIIKSELDPSSAREGCLSKESAKPGT